jgi:mRNA interferase RelE/StbE
MEIEISEGALKNLEALPKKHAAQILAKIEALSCGLHGDIKRLHESDYAYRLRSGKYRILFDIEGEKIVIQKVGDRKNVYDKHC